MNRFFCALCLLCFSFLSYGQNAVLYPTVIPDSEQEHRALKQQLLSTPAAQRTQQQWRQLAIVSISLIDNADAPEVKEATAVLHQALTMYPQDAELMAVQGSLFCIQAGSRKIDGMQAMTLANKGFRQLDRAVIMAPDWLGPFAGTARNAALSFAQVRQWPFIVNALSGGRLCGQFRAVKLNFTPEVLEIAPNFVRQYSVNMANALTPRHPGKQLAELPIPTLLLAAAQDELFSPQAMRDFAGKYGNGRLEFCFIEESTHLDCVFKAHHYIHQYIAGERYDAELYSRVRL
ncbi:hypothetical protein [Enterobacter hormaechei]|uniref:hypothetical protein n=1 Tax=Enterobacter hormaechei TaxID=158836 RepID=UPI0032B0C9E1